MSQNLDKHISESFTARVRGHDVFVIMDIHCFECDLHRYMLEKIVEVTPTVYWLPIDNRWWEIINANTTGNRKEIYVLYYLNQSLIVTKIEDLKHLKNTLPTIARICDRT